MRTKDLPAAERRWQIPGTQDEPRTTATPGRASNRDLYRAAVTGLSPSLLLIGLIYHPHLDDLRDKGTVADALIADTTRWGIAHLVVGVAAALVLLAFLSIDEFLRANGRVQTSSLGVPFIVIGSVLFAFLPAMEIAMLGVYGAGADVERVLLEMNTWFQPILLAGAAVFAVGLAFFAVAITRSRMLGRGLTWLVVAALVIAAATRFVPLGAALYVGGAALVVALVPIALLMVTHPTRDRRRGRRPVPTGEDGDRGTRR
jgi:hypothetical protein